MAARAMWKGTLEFGDQSLPVKLYAAARDTAVRFHLIHARDRVRVKQRWVHPKTGDEVSAGEIRKGYAVQPGALVVLEDAELKQLDPPQSRAIEVTHALPTGSLLPAWFERPYYLGPEGSDREYFALAEVLKSRKRDVLVQWVMRRKRYRGLVRVSGAHLMLFTLRAYDELLAVPKLDVAPARQPEAKELALAEQLVEALQGTFDPSAFTSTYEERVRDLIEQKAKGKRVVLRSVKKRVEQGGSLEKMLKQSVTQLRRHESRESQESKQPKERKSA